MQFQADQWEVVYLENCPQCQCDNCFRRLVEYPFRTEFYVNKVTRAHICEMCYKGRGES